MATNVQKYKKLLVNLLPRGRAWVVTAQETFSDFLDAIAVELCRVEDRVIKFLSIEVLPSTADELLEDWERNLGLPDHCSEGLVLTDDERRASATQKFTTVGGLSKEFYEDLGTQLSSSVEIDHALAFRVGQSRVGESLTNYFSEPFRVGCRVGEQLRREGWRTFFIATIPIVEDEVFRVGQGRVGDPLRDFGNEFMECTLRSLKPAHSAIYFKFT